MDNQLRTLFKWSVRLFTALLILSAVIWIIETYTNVVNLPGQVSEEQHKLSS